MTDDTIREHLPLVHSIAQEVHRKYGHIRPGPEFADLMAFGCAGLLDAHARYDERRQARLETFAYQRIRGAMLDAIRKMGPFSRAEVARHRAGLPAEDARPTQVPAMEPAPFEDPAQAIDSANLRDAVREMVDMLPSRSRELVLSYFYDGKTIVEIAAEVGSSKSWTSRLLAAALDQLRERIVDRYPELVPAQGGSRPRLRQRRPKGAT